MGKSPAFPLYAQDFISDENVVLMNNQEVGCYIKLLCFNWKQGSIPNDIDKIARLCGEDGGVMAELWQAIKPCFVELKKSPGRLVNPRIEKERQIQQRYRDGQSERGKLGAAKRWKNKDKNSDAIATPMANDSLSSSSSSSSSRKDTPPSGGVSPPSKKVPPCPYQKIVDLYHAKLPMLPKVQDMGNGLKTRVRTRWREDKKRQTLEWWDWYFTSINNCDFLVGKVKDWSADFDWLVGPKNMSKVLNGRYLNRGPNTGSRRMDNNIKAAQEFINDTE
jgi:hypothetical protein